jgi:hypothetical protein
MNNQHTYLKAPNISGPNYFLLNQFPISNDKEMINIFPIQLIQKNQIIYLINMLVDQPLQV